MADTTAKNSSGKQPRERLSIRTGPGKGEPIPADVKEIVRDVIIAPEEQNIREAVNRISELFSKIGTEHLPGTSVPAGNKNSSPEAAEYFIASTLEKLAKARMAQAKDAGEKAGIFGDESDYVAGETVMTWQSPFFTINVKRGNASTMINKDQVTTVLEREFGAKKAADLLEECMKERKGTTQIIVSMK